MLKGLQMAERIIIKDLDKALVNIDKINYVERNHLIRYKYALGLLKPNWRVLDIACGSGYGSKMIAELGCSVVGCDISDEALNLCKKFNDHKNIEWKKLNLTEVKDNFSQKFDAIVCFETLEHIAEGQEKVLQDFKDMTVTGAPIITSIPLNHPDKVWHLRQFTFEQRYKMYRDVFSRYDYPEENKSLVIAWNE